MYDAETEQTLGNKALDSAIKRTEQLPRQCESGDEENSDMIINAEFGEWGDWDNGHSDGS